MNLKSLQRRQFLRRLSLGASAPVLAPLLNQLALGAGGKTPPVRFLFVVEGNSLPPKQVHPTDLPLFEREQRKRVLNHSLKGRKLPPALQPIGPWQDRLTVIQGLSGRMCSGGHSSDHGALGAYHANQGRNIQGPTVDGLLGRMHPGIFENIVLGISSSVDKAVDFNCSAAEAGRGLATILHPDIAYHRLFGSVAKGRARDSFNARRNLLHHMQQDIKRVREQIGGVDREKLDAYLHAFESLGSKTQKLLAARADLQKVAPRQTDKYESTVETDRLDAHFELATAALIAGLTNTATIASGVGFPNFSVTFSGLGIDRAKHGIGHGLYNADDRSAWDLSEKIRAFHFQLIARTMKALDQIPEGDGTMLDRTVIVYLSDGAETHHSRCYEWPFVVIGNAGGRLKTDGRYLQIPNYGRPGHQTINTLFNSLLHAADIPRDDFGFLDPNLDESMHRGPVAGLLS
jgi:hypothetical protein